MCSFLFVIAALLTCQVSRHDDLGVRIVPLNDVDGDRCADLALDDGQGRAWVVSGKDGTVIARMQVDRSADERGLITPLFGDANGDGAWDIVEWHTDRELTIRSGKDLHVVLEIPVPKGQDGFIGMPVAAGDWNGDGVPDVAATVVHDRLATIAILSGKDGSVLQSIGERSEWSKRLYIRRGSLALLSSCRAGDMRPASILFRDGGPKGLVLIPHDATNSPIELSHNDQDLWLNAGTGFVGDIDGDGAPDLVVRRYVDMSTSKVQLVRGREGQRDYQLRFVIVSGRTGAELEVMSAESGAMQEGLAVTRIHDLDGDGIGEMLLGDADWWEGKALILSGKDRHVMCTLREDQKCCAGSCRFASNVAALGDVDGDGVDDFAITSSSGVDQLDPGCVAIYSGRTRQRLRSIWKADLIADGKAIPAVESVHGSGYDELGSHITPLNDVDGDRCADFALDDGAAWVWLISGKSGRVIASVRAETALVHNAIAPLFGDVDGDGAWDIVEWRARSSLLVRSGKDLHVVREITPPSSQATFMADPAPAGDWNNDGVPDVAVICSSERGPSIVILSGKDGTAIETIDPGDDWSRTFVRDPAYFADSSLHIVSSCRADDARPASFVLVGGAGNLVLIPRGKESAPVWLPNCDKRLWCNSGTGFVGDVDHDSFPDFVVSTFVPPSASLPLAEKRGADGANSSSDVLHVVLIAGLNGAILESISWSDGRMDGLSAASVGDLDSDGVPDMLIGEANLGTVLVLSGKDRRTLWTLNADDACCAGTCRFGSNVVALGDVDSDGVADFAITSSSGIDHLDPSCVAIYSGKTRQRLRSIWKSDLIADRKGAESKSK